LQISKKQGNKGDSTKPGLDHGLDSGLNNGLDI